MQWNINKVILAKYDNPQQQQGHTVRSASAKVHIEPPSLACSAVKEENAQG